MSDPEAVAPSRPERSAGATVPLWRALVGVAVAIGCVPLASSLSESEDFWIGFLKWPVLVLGVVGWVAASRRWVAVEKLLPWISGFYCILALSFLFVLR